MPGTTTTELSAPIDPAPKYPRLVVPAAAVLAALLLVAIVRRAAGTAAFWPAGINGWIVVHVLAVTPTVPLGLYLFGSAKGTAAHRLLGRVWAGLILVTAFTSFGIHSLTGHLSPIHLLSVYTIFGVARGVWFAMHGDAARHRRSMIGAFAGITVAGLFTFLPGRLMGLWLFG
ncbi:MAG: DUF2306 domain-containing protein [Sphingomonadales bacterium]|nr:DUF2306 domain-containing protein [Sphingomonadales bacterium]